VIAGRLGAGAAEHALAWSALVVGRDEGMPLHVRCLDADAACLLLLGPDDVGQHLDKSK